MSVSTTSKKKQAGATTAISSLFSSTAAGSSGSLASLFQEENRTKFERAVKPAEFVAKRKLGYENDSKKKKKKPKHNKKQQVETQGTTRADTSQIESASSIYIASDSMSTPGEVTSTEVTDENRTIFVGNISLSATVKSLKKYFREFGEVESVRLRSVPIAGVAVDEKGNQSLVKKVCSNSRMFGDQKGSFNAYIVFGSVTSATAALAANNRMLDGRHLRVDSAKATHFDPKLTVFLGSLPHYADEEELRTHFAKSLPNGQDDIESLRLIRDQETLVGKGIGYLLLKNQDAVIRMLSLTQDKFKKREIRISACGKRTKRTEKRKIEVTSAPSFSLLLFSYSLV